MATGERIVRDPAILAGQPVVRGTRISVAFILDRMAAGWSQAELLQHYPGLTAADIDACRRYADAAASEPSTGG